METIVKGKRSADEGTEAVTRTADVLLLFLTGSATLGVSEIARRLDISKAVVHRILRSLLSRDFVAFDTKQRKYRLGPAAAALGAHALRDLDLRQLALPLLRHLQQETAETAVVVALVGTSFAFLDQVPSLQEIKMTVEVGRLFPLNAGASGKAVLAFASPDLRQRFFSEPLPALTTQTKVSSMDLESDLERITRDGVVISFGERQPGACSVAAPIFGVDGYAVGAICVCGPLGRFSSEKIARFIPLVKDTTHTISLQLGWNGTFP
ncbi:MAG TPA: IclR family transcriptional regulator [Ktedonobacteraceae bacterium]|nr:IclR family transcriptional regulator [Ktedonobacteraceae bacterium]